MTAAARVVGVTASLVALAAGAWIAIPPLWTMMVHVFAAVGDALIHLF